jgi:hypothetical protein
MTALTRLRQMRQSVLTIGMLMALAAAGGFYVNRLMQRGEGDLELSFPDRDPKIVTVVAPNQDYGCNAITEAEAFENHIHTDGAGAAPTANARSGVGTDKVALKFTNDGKGIFLLSAFDVGQGATDAGDPIPITVSTQNYIVATRARGLDVVSLILDVKTLKAIVSYTGQGMLGIKGRSLLLACH